MNEETFFFEHYVSILAESGFSYRLISQKTGLSKHQISYILHKIGGRVSDYRSGENKLAKKVLSRIKFK